MKSVEEYYQIIHNCMMDSSKTVLSLALPRTTGQKDEIVGNIMGVLEVKKILHLAEAIVLCFQKGHKVVTFGNGGSAAEAMHIVCELVGRCTMDRKSLPAVCLSTNPATLTAIGNDFGFEHIFSHQVEGIVNKGDVVIGISTSGDSDNVINGIQKANDQKAITFAYIGASGCYRGLLQHTADCFISVLSKNTLRIQEAHMVITHIVCELVELMMFGDKEESDGE